MAYSDFTLEDVRTRLGITSRLAALFPALTPVRVPELLKAQLAVNTPLAYLSEKSRSEHIVSPVLTAARIVTGGRLALFSGQRLDADPERGLVGACDFILALAEPVPPLRAPLVTLVEAKKGDIEEGLGQCVAQMVGLKIFNANAGLVHLPVFGSVTNGDVWVFLRLDREIVTMDTRRFGLHELDEILGAFAAMVATFDEINPPAP